MSVVITASGNHGPFRTIQPLFDRLRCDGEDLPLIVIGAYSISEDDSLAPVPVKSAEDLAAARAAKWAEIKAFRDNRLDTGGYQALGHWYNSDSRAKQEQSSLALRGDKIETAGGDMGAQYVIGGEAVQWKTMDNGYVPMNATLAIAIRDAAEEMTVKTYKAAATHQYFLGLSNDPANYNFSAGWPTVYGDA